ncbi:adenylyl-sulfate kinase [Burkholderia sp. Ax-1724]|uniref:adenylyl-sulfate kinase n=1 Tax=Burkholderia sp. Ax-1724 TaxID=2608336 RepID=UPI001F0350E5|nr:adenylyl-sulfate kinase [Burkholderia sp. Ax-1724]
MTHNKQEMMEATHKGLQASTPPVSARGHRVLMRQPRPQVIWLTGLSGAGKSTLANLLDTELRARAFHTFILDGDRLRLGLNSDLDFSDASRHESIRRASEVARLMVDAGVTVIASLISPFRADRDAARELFDDGQFFEVHVDAPLAVVESRDVKGLYKKAREGSLPLFTGIGSPYESPLNPELRLNTAELGPSEALQQLLMVLDAR